MRASEIINEGWADTAKSLAGRVGSGISNAASGMMNRVKDSDTNWLKGQLYRFGGGKFGQQGNMAATKNIFIKNFVQEYEQIAKSAKKSGMGMPSMEEYVNDYLAQVGWRVNPAQVTKLVSANQDNISNIANGVYTIGMMNQRRQNRPSDQTQQAEPIQQAKPVQQPAAPQSGTTMPTKPYQVPGVGTNPNPTQPTNTASGQTIDVAPTTEKILQTVEKMIGSSYSDDLERIANTALQQLYKSNKTAYAAARKAIINPAQTTPDSSGRIEPTMTESIRKRRKI